MAMIKTNANHVFQILFFKLIPAYASKVTPKCN